MGRRTVALALCLALMGSLVPLSSAQALDPLSEPTLNELVPQSTCTDQLGSGIILAARPSGVPGYHAALYARSWYPTLCAGSRTTLTVGVLNTGSQGWYRGVPGETASLGVLNDEVSVLGGPQLGWPSANRVAAQASDYVGPGQVGWFTFTVQAPTTPGLYRLPIGVVIDGRAWLENLNLTWLVTVKAADPITTVAPSSARTYYPATAGGVRSLRVPALMYHYVEWLPPAPDIFRVDLTASPFEFEQQLQWLKAEGYTTITTSQLWWTLDQGAPLPAKPVLLTFDDGYENHYSVVLPLLQRYGMVGTFFVTANLVDKPAYLSRAQVRALADAGMDVQSHAVDHVNIAAQTLSGQQYQLCTARRILSEWTGTDVRHFAYPGGTYNTMAFGSLQSCGYLTAYKNGGGSLQASNQMTVLNRMRVRGQQGLGALLVALEN